MRFNLSLLFKISFFSCALSLTMNLPSWAEVVDVDKSDNDKRLEDKLYRQALYFYFTGNYDAALRKIGLNRAASNTNSSRSQLFEAGLQVSVGLHHQATQTLYDLEKTQVNNYKNDVATKSINKGVSTTSPEELLLIALLQLAEQQIQQGENKSAQKSLSKITKISDGYNEQYHILSQLAYWPNSPEKLVKVSNNKAAEQQSFTSAYVALNQALLHIEGSEFELAETLLTTLKNEYWHAPEKTFWQLLFNPFSGNNAESSNISIENDQQRQQQAVNDYAKLLLAQMYVKQARYESAYVELKNFPQDSPYTESALFLFAFSAYKTKHYTTSLKLFDLMQVKYPYSSLGWQATLLFAAQVADQRTKEEAMTSYQNAEYLYQQRLTDLADFYRAFLANDNVLNFSSSKEEVASTTAGAVLPLFTQHRYSSDSAWLQKALFDVELQAHYQTLIELDLLSAQLQEQEQNSQWLKDTLLLNKKRKAKIVELQKHSQYGSLITLLNSKKQQFAGVIAQAEIEQQGQVFANLNEEKWLKRIEKSKQVITSIKDHRNTDGYQERLTRIEGVLAWQLQQELPDRLWQHKKQLNAIDQQLLTAEKQRELFAVLAGSQQSLSGMEDRIQESSAEVIVLLNKITELRIKTSNKIHANVKQFVASQGNLLGQYLLKSRHEMAEVLEKMSQLDKRIEMQLAPSAKDPAIQVPSSLPAESLPKSDTESSDSSSESREQR